MNDRSLDLRECSEAAEIVLGRPIRWARLTLYLLGGFLIAGLVWAYFSRVDIHISAPGMVRPKGDLVRIQPVVGGRLLQVMVREGDVVEEGAVLFRIDGKDVETEHKKIQGRLKSSREQLEIIERSERELEDQHGLEIEREKLENDRADLELDKAQNRKKLTQATVQEAEAKLREALAGYERLKELSKEDVVAEAKLLQAETAYRVAEADLEEAKANLEVAGDEISLRAKSKDFGMKKAEVTQKERATALEVIRKNIIMLQQEVSELELENGKLEQDLSDLEVKAQRSGIVTSVTNQAAGEVVQQGDTIATIAPKDAKWIVEAHVSNRDAGPLKEKIGGKVKLKFDAFPFRDYGTVGGTLLEVAPDSTSHPILGRVYRVEVGLDALTLRQGRREGKIQLGMTATVEIVKEEERILSLLFKEVRDRVTYE